MNCGTIIKNNINVIRIPGENIEVIMAEDFPKLMTYTKLQIQEPQITSSRTDIKTTPRNIFKLQKINDEEKT